MTNKKYFSNHGMSLVELLVTVGLTTIVMTAGLMLFNSAQTGYSNVDAKVEMQDHMRNILTRLTLELQESGQDSGGNMQAFITQAGGTGNTDLLRFAVPICVCGMRVLDSNGDIRFWGAPVSWGDTGCGDDYPLHSNGKVIICHHPPGNPTNTQTIFVDVSSVKAHLAHNDFTDECSKCTLPNYSNRWIEYSMDGAGNLIRKVLDSSLNQVSQALVGSNVTDFQASFVGGGSDKISITVEVERTASQGRVLNLNRDHTVHLRNMP